MACPLDAIDALSTACLLDGVEATLAARTPSTRLHIMMCRRKKQD